MDDLVLKIKKQAIIIIVIIINLGYMKINRYNSKGVACGWIIKLLSRSSPEAWC